jgi:hypothetical protein
MAPHEFYYLGNGVKYATDDAFLRSIPIGTEQWQTQWFARALPFMLRADRLLDINVQSADAFVRLGKQCRYLALGYSPDAAPSNVDLAMTKERPLLRLKYVDVASMSADVRPLGERPIDVLFVGALTSRRGDILAQLGPVLAGRNCFLHVTDSSTPLREGNQVDRELFALLARNSRVLLNIHHSEMPYFEWHRVVCYGIWQRSVVITETSFDVPYFREGQHYFGVPASQLGETIERVLASIDANAREPQQMVDESWRVLTERFALRDCVMRI